MKKLPPFDDLYNQVYKAAFVATIMANEAHYQHAPSLVKLIEQVKQGKPITWTHMTLKFREENNILSIKKVSETFHKNIFRNFITEVLKINNHPKPTSGFVNRFFDANKNKHHLDQETLENLCHHYYLNAAILIQQTNNQ